MKKLTFWRRVNVPLAALMALLLMGVGLAWWMQAQRAASRHRNDQLEKYAMAVRWKLVQLSDSLRAELLDPKNTTNKTVDSEAMADLNNILKDIENRYVEKPNTDELMNSLREIRKFGSERL